MRGIRNFLPAVSTACLVLCTLFLSACGSKDTGEQNPTLPKAATENCDGVFIFASSRYIINIVAGESIHLDPARYPIPVYCTAEQAGNAAEAALRSGEAPAAMTLRVYRLDGDWQSLARKEGERYYLAQPSVLIDAPE